MIYMLDGPAANSAGRWRGDVTYFNPRTLERPNRSRVMQFLLHFTILFTVFFILYNALLAYEF